MVGGDKYPTDTAAEQTALVGGVSEEFNCLPVENEEFRRLSEKRALEALKPKRETVFIDKVPGKLLQARNVLPGEKGAFVVCFDWIQMTSPATILMRNAASYEASQGKSPREQDHTYAAERTTGSYLPVLPA